MKWEEARVLEVQSNYLKRKYLEDLHIQSSSKKLMNIDNGLRVHHPGEIVFANNSVIILPEAISHSEEGPRTDYFQLYLPITYSSFKKNILLFHC